ncbi:MAG: metallophosphoesterase [Solobacterium sp.]|nr:metallophosphoesterase [Solobacterium sp.]
MKRLSIILLSLFLAACTAKPFRTEETACEAPDFTAVVISDLHYTVSPSEFNSIVALEPLVQEVTDALIDQVIAMKPDAFILTGDLTNNGKEEDVKDLAAKLRKIRDAGIEVIVTTGNHDFGQAAHSINAWENYILPLLKMDEKDPASYSYMTASHGVTVLAMDDSHPGDSSGYFSPETTQWLRQQLDQAKTAGSRILFLSHHNVLCGEVSPMYSGYLIGNEGLSEMLREYGVQLCMSGHQHNQALWQKDGMYEILNGMPIQSAHTFGLLRMDKNGVSYHTEEIDLKTYGAPGIYDKAMELIEKQSAAFLSTFANLCQEKNLSKEETERVLSLTGQFFASYGRGELGKDAEALLSHPDYALMQSVLWDKNYGPWIEELLKKPPADSSQLSFPWQ